MIPYILAAVGGYLIGDSMKSDATKMADGGMMAKGGGIASQRLLDDRIYNFLKDDLSKLEISIKENDQEEIDKFFSYWNIHIKSLEPKTGSKRIYNFLKDDLSKLEISIKENDQEEIDRFFSYWNIHINSLEPKTAQRYVSLADGGNIEERYIRYRGYKIDEDNTGYAPKNLQFHFWIGDGDDPMQYGKSIEDCKEQIDEIILDEKWFMESESIREHYINSYPTDELGSDINPEATFDGLYKVLEKGKDAYAYIGVGDSIVRERIFEKLAYLKGVDYEVIYRIWLKTNKMKNQMTIREIIRVLFETEKYTVIGADEMTNKESRDFLYAKYNQDEIMNVIDNGSHLLIWK